MRIIDWNSLDKAGRAAALARPFPHTRAEATRVAGGIIERVRRAGDEALLALTHQYDGVRLKALAVSQTEIEQARQGLSSEAIAALKRAIANVRAFHEGQVRRPLNV